MDERWLPVLGFVGYEVSDLGRVRSVDRVVATRSGLRRYPGRLLSFSLNPRNGYLQVSLGRAGKLPVHRLVARAFLGEPPPGHEVCHGPGGRHDNRLVNLRWDTKSANSIDHVESGSHNMASRTTCPAAHLLVAPNLLADRLPRRVCLSCQRGRERVRYRPAGADWRVLADEVYASLGFAA